MDEETRALTCCITSFLDYDRIARFNIIDLRYKKLEQLKKQHIDTHSSFLGKISQINYYDIAKKILEPQLDLISECISNNSLFLSAIAQEAVPAFGIPQDFSTWEDSTISEVSNVVSLLAQVSREWSLDGATERDISMGLVIKEIEFLFPELDPDTMDFEKYIHDLGKGDISELNQDEIHRLTCDRTTVNIVVPGCGLGRLPLELAARGFSTQGNEVSPVMLFASNFILNGTKTINEYQINPWIHSFSHVRDKSFQVRPVLIPDIHPGEFLSRRTNIFGKPSGSLSIVSGSFDEVYPTQVICHDMKIPDEVLDGNSNSSKKYNEYDPDKRLKFQNTPIEFDLKENITQVDVVATVFFIDTTPNVFKTLDVISKMLKKGGFWINFGPLLWHYEHNIPSCDNINVTENMDPSCFQSIFHTDHNTNDAEIHENLGIDCTANSTYQNKKYISHEDRSAGLEVSLNDLLSILPLYGFRIYKRESSIRTPYAIDSMSMLINTYDCEYWVAVKE